MKARADIAFTLEPLPAPDALEKMWRALDRAGTNSFFLSWLWVGTWLRLLPSEFELRLLRALHGGETVGLAIIVMRRKCYCGILPMRQAWLNTTGERRYDCLGMEHNGFVSRPDWSERLWPPLVTWFADGGIEADELVLPGILRRDLNGGTLLQVERRTVAYHAPLEAVRVAGSIEPLLSRNARQQLRRSMRACAGGGTLGIEVAKTPEEALDFFEQMKAMHIRSWSRRKIHHAFARPFFERFHRALIAEGIADRSVELLRVSSGARTLGILYNFRRGGIISSYQSGFEDGVSQARPGYVCHALAMAHYAAEGAEIYDFLAGTNRLKQSFGSETYEMCWLRLRRATLAFRAEDLARTALERIRGNQVRK